MKRLEGVTQTKLRIARETRLEVYTRGGGWLPPQRMLEQIARGKFDARKNDIRVTGTGVIRIEGERIFIALGSEDARTELLLASPPGEKPGAKNPLAGLEEQAGQTVEITGLWRPESSELPQRLLVSQWKVRSPRKGTSP